MSEPLMILIAGRYRSGTNDHPMLIQTNVDAYDRYCAKAVPTGSSSGLGEWFALPMMERAGSRPIGDAIFGEIFHPVLP